MYRMRGCYLVWLTIACLTWSAASLQAADDAPAKSSHPLRFIDSTIENGSPLYWEIDAQQIVHIYLVYDQERDSPNRANGHWHFKLEVRAPCDLTLVLHNFDNIWNGQPGSPLDDRLVCFTSPDGKTWQVVHTKRLEGNLLQIALHLDTDTLYVTRLEPYRLSDLKRWEQALANNQLVEIQGIGQTVEGRELEIIRVGNPNAPHRILLRARAHPWEPGGNWVIEGLVGRLLRGDADAQRFLSRYCLYILPMANKDGVAHGRTRFNLRGCDLNRQWDRPADPQLAPENAALETWLSGMIARGQPPDLMIDFHNDNDGKLHVSSPESENSTYQNRMRQLAELLRQHTWFTEGTTDSQFRNPSTIGEGLLERHGIVACIHELNAVWIAGLNDYPTAANWRLYGEQLCEVFWQWCDE
jgi:hypothetical protein